MSKFEFGNYTLKFGEEKVLLDMYEEIVHPTFLEMKYRRKIKNAEYFFIDTEVLKLSGDGEEPVVGIYGRIVKNTKLKREQIFGDEGLVEDHKELDTAPSSAFLLILNNHRLVFCREVTGAPTIENFMATSEYFLKNRHQEYIQAQFDEAKAAKEQNPELKRVTKVNLLQDCPRPKLRITALTDKQNLQDFLDRFNQIDRLSIKLLPTNKEQIDNDDFWASFGAKKDKMNSPTTKIEFSNPKDGLSPEAVLKETTAAVGLGNSDINLSGIDVDGDRIKGDNNDFDLSVDVDEVPKAKEEAAKMKYQTFMELAARGAISLPALGADVIEKVKTIFDRL